MSEPEKKTIRKTDADRQAKYIIKMKKEGKYDKYLLKKKDAMIKSRDKKKNELKETMERKNL